MGGSGDGDSQESWDSQTDAQRAAALNLRLARPLVQFARDRGGQEAIVAMAERAGLDVDTLERGSVWVSVAQFEALLAAGREMVASDDEFREACAYKMVDGYGPFRFLVHAAQPLAVYRQAARTFHLISRISSLEIAGTRENRVELRYTSSEPESRLLCLSRQAQMCAAPTLWGLPRARLEERGCIAHGDAACVYVLELYHHRSWVPTLAGGAVGALIALGLSALSVEIPWEAGLWIALGTLAGYVFELRRTNRKNLAVGEEANEALRKLSREEAEARLEIVELTNRQRRWTQLLEEQLTERSAAMQDLVERIRRVSEERENTLRGVSHDLGNPLMTLLSYTSVLAAQGADPAALRDMEAAIDRMRLLLRELMSAVKGGDVSVSFSHEELDVSELTDAMRRRLRALVFGRDIRVSVFRSREAPDSIQCNRILFDRVVDNLLTNAAKYTAHGSIVLEVGGTPGYLTLKLSDTGRGIPASELEKIFSAEGSDESTRAKGSFGVGLSVVVHLLGRIGGRLEVMSKPDVGTTFWAHFPVVPVEEQNEQEPTQATEISKVLTIRRGVES